MNEIIYYNLERMQYKDPLPIQKYSLRASILAHKDVIISARTGSGKTLAFGLPILNSILNAHALHQVEFDNINVFNKTMFKNTLISALIIAPTRELVEQIHSHLSELVKVKLKDANTLKPMIKISKVCGGTFEDKD